jgi:squalene-hopene/tetraprenyl-beta-curcumene cyclase
LNWLRNAQNEDGGWGAGRGTPSSVEETALAIDILCADPASEPAALRGLTWLMDRVEDGTWREPTPIGFYFAKLWYFERLYPLIFTVAALRVARSLISTRPDEAQPSPASPD